MFNTIIDTAHYYYDRLEHHLPFKPSKWDRKYKLALLALGVLFFIMAIVAFALHDKVWPNQASAKNRLSTCLLRMRNKLLSTLEPGLFLLYSS